MKLIVQKFGGSSVRDAGRLMHVASIIADTYRAGNQVIAVLSAQGDMTDELIGKAKEINPRASKRELDMLLSTGEQISVALCAMALEGMGLPVVSLAAWQVGIHTTDRHGSARIEKIDHHRIRQELDNNKIVLVAGFQGIDSLGDVTTLGRGGSDTSAVALAAAFQSDVCQIYTDVDGIYTTDPRITPSARKLQEITYDEMLELANQGAQVLHNCSVELAKEYHVDLEVRSSLEYTPGTKVKESADTGNAAQIAGVAKDTAIVQISLVGLENTLQVAILVFSLLNSGNMIHSSDIFSFARMTEKEFSFTVSKANFQDLIAMLEENKVTIGFDHIDVDDNIAKISVVGTDMVSTPGIAARMLVALHEANVNVQMIHAGALCLSVIVERQDADMAVCSIHDKFFADPE